MKILITGGTGFIGTGLCENLVGDERVKKVVSFSRRWDASEKLMRHLDSHKMRVINGDVCDYNAVLSATRDMDYIIHAAAYKSVPSAEYNPIECSRVNVDGSINVIRAAIANGVKNVLFISSDKACDPINTYGRAKALVESLMVNANNLGNTRFAVARYGNILGSTGSVVPFFESLIENGEDELPVTDLEMTRFWFRKDDAVKYVLKCTFDMVGGETFIPKLRSSSMAHLITALGINHGRNFSVRVVGVRPGEKFHELMISINEVRRTIDLGWTFVILPFQTNWASEPPYAKDAVVGVEFKKYSSDWDDARNAGSGIDLDELADLIST